MNNKLIWFITSLFFNINWAFAQDFTLISSRYRDNGDGTIIDTTTNLMWKRCSEGQTWVDNACEGSASIISWDDAMPGGKQKNWEIFADHTNWRVPTRKELNNLVLCSDALYERHLPLIDQDAFPQTPKPKLNDPLGYWTSELKDQDHNRSEVVYFSYVCDQDQEHIQINVAEHTIHNRVRLVRDQKSVNCPIQPEMVQISSGCFQMGSSEDTAGRGSDEHLHRACVNEFKLSKYEVTNNEFRCFRPDHNSGDRNGISLDGDNQPVVQVSWEDALAYIDWLNLRTGQSYRLPTETEWEYAAQAGTTTSRFWGNNPEDACQYANVSDKSAKAHWSRWAIHNCNDGYAVSAPVGRFKPNPWGLYDMLGNVWEWTCSLYANPYDEHANRCATRDQIGARVLRGGSWENYPRRVRSAYRDGSTPGNRDDSLGFRLVQDNQVNQ